jgi:hypothetical protein
VLTGTACYVRDLVSSAPAALADERRRTSANNPPADERERGFIVELAGDPPPRFACCVWRFGVLRLGQNVGASFLVGESSLSDPIDTVTKTP